MTDAADRYIDLLKGCLTRSIFADPDFSPVQAQGWRGQAVKPLQTMLSRRGIELVREIPPRPLDERPTETPWPQRAETMLSQARLDNLQECVVGVINDGVPGDLIETGVWRGGACILMRGILAAYGVTDRTVWVADSFQGLPPSDPDSYPADSVWDLSGHDELAVSVEQVKSNFARYGLLDEQVRFLVGWFKDSLPTAPLDTLAVARLDGDLYESTIQALDSLYPRLSVGGYLIVDDYTLPPCKKAVTDYRTEHGIEEPITQIDWVGAYWRRETA